VVVQGLSIGGYLGDGVPHLGEHTVTEMSELRIGMTHPGH
jgi:hypothetical protein